MKKKNIYIAGKVKDPNHDFGRRLGGWRYNLIKELFDVELNISLNSAEDSPNKIRIFKINETFNYVGPYLYGCDHGCSHAAPFAHGVLTCTQSSSDDDIAWGKKPSPRILDLSLRGIDKADIIIADFTVSPLNSYGTIAEIGYAYASGKIILGLGALLNDLWFVQQMCTMVDSVDELKTKLYEIN